MGDLTDLRHDVERAVKKQVKKAKKLLTAEAMPEIEKFVEEHGEEIAQKMFDIAAEFFKTGDKAEALKEIQRFIRELIKKSSSE